MIRRHSKTTPTLEMVIWGCRCEKCGHAWQATAKKEPRRCPRCKSRKWRVASGVLKPARSKLTQ